MQQECLRIFVGSSRESLDLAKAVQANLHQDFEVTVWNQRKTHGSQHFISSLISDLRYVDYGVFVLSPDDLTESHKEKKWVPRDNVILEIGIFIGRLGFPSIFLLVPFGGEDLRLPSDLAGIQQYEYSLSRSDSNWMASMAPACFRITHSIADTNKSIDDTNGGRKIIEWSVFSAYTKKLVDKINASPRNGGYIYDIIVGISNSGIIAADLISRRCGAHVPVVCLSADRKTEQPLVRFDTGLNLLLLETVKRSGYVRILLVEDMVNTGYTIDQAKNLLQQELGESVEIRCAAIIKDRRLKTKLDYFGEEADTQKIITPFAAK